MDKLLNKEALLSEYTNNKNELLNICFIIITCITIIIIIIIITTENQIWRKHIVFIDDLYYLLLNIYSARSLMNRSSFSYLTLALEICVSLLVSLGVLYAVLVFYFRFCFDKWTLLCTDERIVCSKKMKILIAHVVRHLSNVIYLKCWFSIKSYF